MTRTLISLALACLFFPGIAGATEKQPRAKGIESPGYAWNTPDPDLNRALAYKASARRGKVAYKICRGCHLPDGTGQAGEVYPQLAGQHPSVVLKQMMDIRAGRRDNPKMFPFSGEWIVSVEELADIAAYLKTLPPPAGNGKGDGTALERGKALYDKDCAGCHGRNGEGDNKRFHPLVAHQHYDYLLRETRESRDQGRRNASPEMVKVLRGYSDADVAAVSDYMSRLTLPARP
ncbi:MAG: c-type cytochrome [Pseudomonadota bacterium]